MDKKEFRVLIKNGDSVPRKSTIIDWYAEFKRGLTNTDDAESSGRPKSAIVP